MYCNSSFVVKAIKVLLLLLYASCGDLYFCDQLFWVHCIESQLAKPAMHGQPKLPHLNAQL